MTIFESIPAFQLFAGGSRATRRVDKKDLKEWLEQKKAQAKHTA